MSKHDVQCLWELGAQLGEGPLWVAEQNRLYFVDLKNQKLHALDTVSGERHSWTMPDYICWLIARRDGDGFMAGLRDGKAPRFVKRYADLSGILTEATRQFADEVRGGEFPAGEHTF